MDQPGDLADVGASYDRVSDSYVAGGFGRLEDHPWLRAALAAFAEDVRGRGPVLDVGCGPGHVTAHLAGLGLDISGVDLSPGMIAHARQLHPGLEVSVASATALGLADGSLGGALGFWSLFHLPRPVLPQVLASVFRALRPGGSFLLGTHVGDGEVVRTVAYGGVPVSWTTYLWQPPVLIELLGSVGFELVADLRLPVTPPGIRPQVLLAASVPD